MEKDEGKVRRIFPENPDKVQFMHPHTLFVGLGNLISARQEPLLKLDLSEEERWLSDVYSAIGSLIEDLNLDDMYQVQVERILRYMQFVGYSEEDLSVSNINRINDVADNSDSPLAAIDYLNGVTSIIPALVKKDDRQHSDESRSLTAKEKLKRTIEQKRRNERREKYEVYKKARTEATCYVLDDQMKTNDSIPPFDPKYVKAVDFFTYVFSGTRPKRK